MPREDTFSCSEGAKYRFDGMAHTNNNAHPRREINRTNCSFGDHEDFEVSLVTYAWIYLLKN